MAAAVSAVHRGRAECYLHPLTLNPKPQTPNPKPQTPTQLGRSLSLLRVLSSQLVQATGPRLHHPLPQQLWRVRRELQHRPDQLQCPDRRCR